MSDEVVPIIDLSTGDTATIASDLRSACIDIGFFYLKGHSIAPHVFVEALQQTRILFQSLSLTSKLALTDHVLSRGYTAMGEETLDPATQRQGDTKEGFYIAADIAETDPRYNPAKLAGPNQWPSPEKTPEMKDCEAFRVTMENYFVLASNLGRRLVQLLALSLGLDFHHWDADFVEPMAALRLLHYAPVQSRPEDGLFAAGAHSDYGMLTLLLTDDQSGLQVLTKQNVWVDVPPRKDCLVVNLGDMLERWTNGLYVSTKHRVLTAGERDRYSVPFFFEPNFDTRVECLPICCSTENPARYPPTTSGQHILDKYKETHADFAPSST